MSGSSTTSTARVAILVDCDNVSPEIAEFALQKTAGLGRLVIRRGYGMHPTLGGKWQEMLVREAFTPCLQYAYAPRKNTTDIALALDAMEILLDGRADAFCLVTSDSDFAYLCRKLRERGAAVYIVGDTKSPPALRKACDQFFEGRTTGVVSIPAPLVKQPAPPAAKKSASPVAKQSPSFVLDAVRHLASQAPGGKVGGNELMQHLTKAHPGFS
ncbi:MAG: NYN domain-containing protein, partial [Stenotrophomonas sp.]|nr:NYN domain-containing protein [Stenotrophomonas sp.]